MDSQMPRVHLISATPDPLGAIAAACRMYEGKPTYHLAELTNKEREAAWEQVQSTHLKAPLEFVDLHFFIEGVTRAFTHQMVRQRTAVYAQESLRFAVKEEIAARPGPVIMQDKQKREVWEEAMQLAHERYLSLIANGTPAEEARGLLPHDTLTRLNYKTNLRNLVDHAGNRLCTQAQFEWRLVFIGIVNAIRNHNSRYEGFLTHQKIHPVAGVPLEPEQRETESYGAAWQWELIAESGVFKPVCFQVGHCPFNASFDRGCTIKGRVEEGKFDEIEPREYMADPTAAWVR